MPKEYSFKELESKSKEELVGLVLEGLSSNPRGYSSNLYHFLVESELGLEVINRAFTLVGEEDSRYLDLVGLLG